MQLHILNAAGDTIGGCSLEGTSWKLGEDGLTNDGFIKIILDRPITYRDKLKAKISNSNGTHWVSYNFNLLGKADDWTTQTLIFYPGDMVISQMFRKSEQFAPVVPPDPPEGEWR